jgi:hypothetical protein
MTKNRFIASKRRVFKRHNRFIASNKGFQATQSLHCFKKKGFRATQSLDCFSRIVEAPKKSQNRYFLTGFKATKSLHRYCSQGAEHSCRFSRSFFPGSRPPLFVGHINKMIVTLLLLACHHHLLPVRPALQSH